jgi:hypothetical protein
MKARVTVTRRSDNDARERQVVVSIDGRNVATLMFGDSVTHEVEPGRHRLRVHNTLVWKTENLDLQPGETATFTVVNRPGTGTSGLLSLIGARPLYVELRRE